MTYNELKTRFKELLSRRGRGSIKAKDILTLILDLIDKIMGIDVSATATIRKSYNSLAEANADKTLIDPETNKPLKIGQLISVVSDPVIANNAIYRLASISADGTPTWERQAPLGDMSKYLKDEHDSSFYRLMVNVGKNYPIDYEEGYPFNYGKSFILDAKISAPKYYRINFAYSNRTHSNTASLDNSICLLVFNPNTDELIEKIWSVQNEEITIGNTGVCDIHLHSDTLNIHVILTLLLDNMPTGIYDVGYEPNYNGYNKLPFMEKCFSYSKTATLIDDQSKKHYIKKVGDVVYIAAKFNQSQDIIMTFKPCLFNNLFSFSKVGLANNSTNYPSIKVERQIIAQNVLNSAYSDNIGPIFVHNKNGDSFGLVGGNHSYREQGKVKTAKTTNVRIVADGIDVNDGMALFAKSVVIEVDNEIYNPTFEPTEGADTLTEVLCYERVIYKIDGPNIKVSCTHKYVNDIALNVPTYYGLQSMCYFEDSRITPNGGITTFTPLSDNVAFRKKDYPNFNRFIEKKNSGEYQMTYLLPIGDGNHKHLSPDDYIFDVSTTKAYHKILSGFIVQDGTHVSWHGIYSWFNAIEDNEDVLIYKVQLESRILLFITAKQTISNYEVALPLELRGANFTIVENYGITGLDQMTDAIGISISADNHGAAILSF